ncbi:unnamed protein product [Phytomonas sp. EM1]|nr:unnamed protein product [Phytomonas sp. EM1]|eukprot:CCW63542.1 unnamed protein product [Phytomonas sp. isolate EM1]
MSGVCTHKISFCLNIKRILGACTVIFGCSGTSIYIYYQKIWLPEYIERFELENKTPVRHTKLYLSEINDNGRTLARINTMPNLLFYLYVAYRILLLAVSSVPLIWYAFLSFGLGLCSHYFFYHRVLLFLSFMGPSYIKLGQWIATRPDLFPIELCNVLERLYDQTEPHSWRHTEKLLQRKYEDGICCGNDAFYYLKDVERIPINSGSIAQIHRARLKESIDGVPSGTELVVKVTHPFIRDRIAADLTAMHLFVKVVNIIVPGAHVFNLDHALINFSRLICSQVNLRIECDNMEQFRYNFRNTKGVLFPVTLPSLISEDVLFETFEEGSPIYTLDASLDNKDIAELGCHMFLKMLFQDNFVHSDLHPGNVLLRTNYMGGAPKHSSKEPRRQLIVLDTGLVTSMSKQERNNFIALFAAVACGDGELGADLMLDRLPENVNQQLTKMNRENFRREMKSVFDLVAPGTEGFKLGTINISEVLAKVLKTVRENNVLLDGNFASLVFTVIVGEGLGRRLTPDFNLFVEAAPYLITYLEKDELWFLANKLRETYGVSGLIRDTVDLVRTEKANTYFEAFAKKSMDFLECIFISMTN